MDNVARPARDYELMVILLPDMPEEDTQAALDKVRGYITSVGAEISEVLTDSPWGRRRLAYTIRHESVDYRDGFYTVIHFSAQPGVISDIERELKLDTTVIRYLLVMDDPKAGEKVTEQPEAAATGEEPAETTEEAPANEEAPAAAATEETPAAEAPAETSADESGTEAAVEETAETIEGEEEPAPADGAEVEATSKES